MRHHDPRRRHAAPCKGEHRPRPERLGLLLARRLLLFHRDHPSGRDGFRNLRFRPFLNTGSLRPAWGRRPLCFMRLSIASKQCVCLFSHGLYRFSPPSGEKRQSEAASARHGAGGRFFSPDRITAPSAGPRCWRSSPRPSAPCLPSWRRALVREAPPRRWIPHPQ